ncbi:MAG: flagellar basal-body MS-ring/collar protein FliF [Solirubrobacteraceae bacterium]
MNFKLSDITAKLSVRGWLTVGAAALVGVVFVYLLMSFASAPSYTTLVGSQSPTQAQKISSALAGAGIPYRLTNSGTGIDVATSDVGRARDLLSTQGLLLGSPQSFETLLGKSSLGATSLQQQEQETSALEQQLDQEIETMNGINSAQVQLAIPDATDSLFTGTNQQASGSVLLNDNQALSQTTVKAIAQQVAGSVPGLSIDRVTVTDQAGDLLWPSSSDDGSAGLTAAQSADNAYDTQKAQAADAYLAATIGPDKALVQVAAVLNTDQQTVSSVTYGTKGTALSSTVTTQTLSGTGTTPSAAGNTATSIASVAGSSNNGNSNYKSASRSTQFGVSKTISQSKVAPGTLARQTISVLVNKSVPASEIPIVKQAVETSLGFVPKRDTISIGTVAFPKPVVAPAAGSSSSQMLGYAKYLLLGIGALLFLFFMRRGLRRSENEQFAGSPTWLRELDTPRPLSALEQPEMVDIEQAPVSVARLRSPINVARQQIEELVDRDPERVAAQIRQWMTED